MQPLVQRWFPPFQTNIRHFPRSDLRKPSRATKKSLFDFDGHCDSKPGVKQLLKSIRNCTETAYFLCSCSSLTQQSQWAGNLWEPVTSQFVEYNLPFHEPGMRNMQKMMCTCSFNLTILHVWNRLNMLLPTRLLWTEQEAANTNSSCHWSVHRPNYSKCSSNSIKWIDASMHNFYKKR